MPQRYVWYYYRSWATPPRFWDSGEIGQVNDFPGDWSITERGEMSMAHQVEEFRFLSLVGFSSSGRGFW